MRSACATGSPVTIPNFLAETGISDKDYTSDVLNYSAVIQDLLDYNDPNGIAVSSVTIIDENGIISGSG